MVILKFDHCFQLYDGHHNEDKMMSHFLSINNEYMFPVNFLYPHN